MNLSILEHLQDCSVLELGPWDGSTFTPHIAQRASSLTLVEYDKSVVDKLYDRYPDARTIWADYHDCLNRLGTHDAVVLFGVLSHTPAPLKLLEDIVYWINPKFILIEAEPGPHVRCVREAVNESLQRQASQETCGLSIQLGHKVYEDALDNLGYTMIEKTLPIEGAFKSGLVYSAWLKN